MQDRQLHYYNGIFIQFRSPPPTILSIIWRIMGYLRRQLNNNTHYDVAVPHIWVLAFGLIVACWYALNHSVYNGIGVAISDSPLHIVTAVPSPLEILGGAGITNRFHVLFGWLDKARDENRSLILYWYAEWHCPGTFDSVFNTTFLPSDLVVLSTKPDHEVNRTWWHPIGRPAPRNVGPLLLKYLHPVRAVQTRIDAMLTRLGWPAVNFSAGKCA